jgi:hypothetical protein
MLVIICLSPTAGTEAEPGREVRGSIRAIILRHGTKSKNDGSSVYGLRSRHHRIVWAKPSAIA